MKDSPIGWLRMLGILMFLPLPLFAQQGGPQGTKVRIGSGTSLTLPPGWTVMESHQDMIVRVGSSLDLKGTALLLTARPQDARRGVVLSVYRSSYPSAGPAPLDENHGTEAEAEKQLCAVLNLGYIPVDIAVSNFNASSGMRMVSVDITARNQGEVRVFSERAAVNSPAVFRLALSRAKDDEATARDFDAIANSLAVREKLPPGAENKAADDGKAATPTAPAASVTPAASAEAGQLVANYSEALAIIEGKDATGSGFICKTEDNHTYVYTNAHVAAASGGFKITNLKSAVLTPGASGVAVGHDIVRIEVKDATKTFEIMPNLDSAAKIGDIVIVLGNIRGGMVVKPVEGTIQGIGPNLVEVDAPFEPGNSGSPIIHKASGRVIGIATYLTQRKVDDHKGSVSTDIRRFGYRLDSVKSWEPINWPVFFTQAAIYNKIDDVSRDFVQFCNSKAEERVDPSNYKSPAMQHAIQNHLGRTKGQFGANRRHFAQGEIKLLSGQLLSDLRSAAKNDLVTFDMRTAYDYFRRQMEDQIKFRDEIYNDISKNLDQSLF